MTNNTQSSYLARRVIIQIIESYPEVSENTAITTNSLTEAIQSLKPFEPEPSDIVTINAYLAQRQATDIACKAAWALYKDLVINGHNSDLAET